VVLTDAGRSFREAVREGLQTIATVAEDVRQGGYSEAITIYAELALAAYWLMPRLAIFERENSEVQIRVVSSSQPLDRVTEHFDIGLQTSPRIGQKQEPAITVREEIFPVCSPDYLARCGGALTLEDLPSKTLLNLRDDAFNWTDWKGFLTHFGVASPDDAELRIHNSYPVLLQAVITGQGIALGWRHSISRLLESGALVRVLDESFEVEDSVFAFAQRQPKPGSNAEKVFRWIGDELQKGDLRT
jgi:DNA-binding transcriptional LysR family regulator